MKRLDDATVSQNRAADPKASTWLSANAGSGKTRVLTDRVARLLLHGVEPQNVICLTYTKAAASEMQNRLFKRLGEWAMLADEDLRAALQGLGETAELPLERARTLFARAIETPGGLRIQTIHSFCAALLRRFPVEAGVAPRFVEIDDAAQLALSAEVLDAIAEGPEASALDVVAPLVSGSDLNKFAKSVLSSRNSIPIGERYSEVLSAFGLPPGATEAYPVELAFSESIEGLFQVLLPAMEASSSAAQQQLAVELGRVNLAAPGPSELEVLERTLLIKSEPKIRTHHFPVKSVVDALGSLIDDFRALQDRVLAARDARLALEAARATYALYQFADVFLPAYAEAKSQRGYLDFDDLIAATERLLTNPETAAWVRYKLDGAIEHILVDEAQDTNPAQWRIIKLLTEDFGAGDGTFLPGERTVFVVGDKKQSIYSFQGARPDAFDEMKDTFETSLASVGGVASLELQHSFRSAAPILQVVDNTFPEGTAPGLGGGFKHLAFHDAMPGRVDLWPVIPPPEKPEEKDWFDPVALTVPNHASQQLADNLATEIKRLINDPAETIPCKNGEFRRPIVAGDFLILVRGRSKSAEMFQKIIRACKAQGLPMAGADRLKLREELAVQDLRSLLSFLALPEDDLSLAEALRSPLFGWTEQDLFSLAARRKKGIYLWTALRAKGDEHSETLAVLRDLRAVSDFLRPYELLERILIQHNGRAKLVARLGTEAEDGIDELLNLALAYERAETPSLTGFLARLETDETEVKRQPDTSSDKIRVMTIHGAKGLEAPIVILPDTLSVDDRAKGQFLKSEAGNTVMRLSDTRGPRAMHRFRDAQMEADEEERQRLLYVAMTRAENWLVVCGAGNQKEDPRSWYNKVEAGIQASAPVTLETPVGPGWRIDNPGWYDAPLEDAKDPTGHGADLPEWARQQATPPDQTAKLLSPSDLGGAKALPGDPGGTDEEHSKRRGRQIHKLLEHLPNYPRDAWRQTAEALLRYGEDMALPAEIESLYSEAAATLLAPHLQSIFAADALAEVDLTAALPEFSGRPMLGTIDRLIVTDAKVTVIDFKSNVMVPDGAHEVPEGVLRQMGAYLSALRQIFPDHEIELAIIWTRTAEHMVLPHDIVMNALERAATS